MAWMDMILNLADKKTDVLAKVLNKSPQEIRSAIAQGKKILPEITANPSAENGARILNNMGIDKSFVDNAFNKYGKFAAKLGLDSNTVKSAVGTLERAMDNKTTAQKPNNSFDSSKYPRL